MKATLTAHINIDASAWKRIQAQASRERRPLPEVLGELLEIASEEPASAAPTPKLEYQPPPLTRLWLRRHPDTIIDRD